MTPVLLFAGVAVALLLGSILATKQDHTSVAVVLLILSLVALGALLGVGLSLLVPA